MELEDIKKAKNVIISKNIQCPDDRYSIGVNILSDNMVDKLKYHTDHYRNNFVLSDAASSYINSKYSQIIADKKIYWALFVEVLTICIKDL